MGTNNTDFTDADLQALLKQAKKVSFERLQHKTTIPTVLISGLIDSPSNWMLSQTFFDVSIKDREKRNHIHNLIIKIEEIAIESHKGYLEEIDYYINFEFENPIRYQGFWAEILLENKDQLLESEKLNCISFRSLCDCISLRSYARLLFNNQQYEEAFYCITLACYVFGYAQKELSIPNDFQKMIAEQNRQKSIEYWKPRNEEKEKLKAKYLRIMNEQGFTKYTDAAEHIYAKENLEKKKYRYIYDVLREADK